MDTCLVWFSMIVGISCGFVYLILMFVLFYVGNSFLCYCVVMFVEWTLFDFDLGVDWFDTCLGFIALVFDV